MRRYAVMAAVAAAAVGLSVGTQRAADHEHARPGLDKCAKACADCMRECESCHRHCMMMLAQGKKEHHTTANTTADCADVCAAAAKIVARGGPFAGHVCEACAKACEACGAECDKSDDPHMKRCAKACKECAAACREMLKGHGTGHKHD